MHWFLKAHWTRENSTSILKGQVKKRCWENKRITTKIKMQFPLKTIKPQHREIKKGTRYKTLSSCLREKKTYLSNGNAYIFIWDHLAYMHVINKYIFEALYKEDEH